jgi:hypothetical protein
MTSNAYLYRMPSGVPGAIARDSVSTIEPARFDPDHPFAAYGAPGKIANGRFVPLASGDTVEQVYGLLVRPYPVTGGAGSEPRDTATPPQAGAYAPLMADVLKRGYMTVANTQGTPALNGPVYIRVAAAAAGKPIGAFSASADSTAANTPALPGAVFLCAADADGNVEIAYNL